MAAMDEEKAKMLRGELYHAFTPSLIAEREECSRKCHIFNTTASELSRLERINLWNRYGWRIPAAAACFIDSCMLTRCSIVGNPPLPADAPEEVLDNAPWVEPPFHTDYGTNLRIGDNVFINFNCTITDPCVVRIGSRTLIGPNVSVHSATHPLDPELRNGTKGPECGKEITIGEDCWIGGGVTVLPGVTIGKGSVVGAASVVTKVCNSLLGDV
jgi:acetyltransferase-like isoleucine patch superfamily enzyme